VLLLVPPMLTLPFLQGELKMMRWVVAVLGTECLLAENRGNTPAILAASKGELRMVRYLVETLGEDCLLARAQHGRTVAHRAVDGAHEPVLRYIGETLGGAFLRLQDDEGRYPRIPPAVVHSSSNPCCSSLPYIRTPLWYLERGRGARAPTGIRRQDCITQLKRMLATDERAPPLARAQQRLALAKTLHLRLGCGSAAECLVADLAQSVALESGLPRLPTYDLVWRAQKQAAAAGKSWRAQEQEVAAGKSEAARRRRERAKDWRAVDE